jgi:phosphoribosylanthranilate isomerase
MEVKLKVCGMREKVNIMEVARAHPDYMGFIFFRRSPRFVGDSFQIPPDFPASITRVGVFVDEPQNNIEKMAHQHGLHLVQLHGSETPEVCSSLRASGLGVIKVFSLDNNFDFAGTKRYRDVTDFFLFDTKGKLQGGNGRAFDWKVLEKYDQQKPFFLSGGITPDNVNEGILRAGLNIHAVDVNSGVEIMPAVKDPSRIKALQNRITERSKS